MLRLIRLAFTVSLVSLLACGPSKGESGGSDGGGGDPADAAPNATPGTLQITPGDVTLRVQNGTAASQQYVATFTDDNGDQSDVTASTTFSVSLPSVGSFAGATFTSAVDRAGRVRVTGTYEGKTATAMLTVYLEHVIVEPGAPGTAPGSFDGAATGGVSPTLVYPSSGVILPPNLNTIEFHFLPGAGNNVFELEFVGGLVGLKIYLTCTALADGCVWAPSESTWELLATAARGEDPLFYTLRGLGGAGATVGESGTNSMSFSSDDLLGGIYYWATEGASGSIKRYEFGRRGQSAENYLSTSQTGGTTCVGCHTLSRDGSRITVGLDIPGPAGIETYTVATRAKLWGESGSGGLPGSGGGANFYAFSPDASQIITSDGNSMVLRDAATGSGSTTIVASGTMPDWSPDGTTVVFARPASSACPIPGFCGGNPGISSGSIVTAQVGSWNTETTLVSANGDNNYYPSISPDGKWILFNKTNVGDSYDAVDAEVWMVPTAGGTAIRLQNASPPTGGDSWPKWAPFVHNYKGGQVMWLTFSSRRDYGLRLKNSTMAQDSKKAQVWMVGFDPAQAAAGNDPSFTAFWLPFQDLASGNHIAQWVEEVDRQECTPGDCPTGEFCEGGVCLPVID